MHRRKENRSAPVIQVSGGSWLHTEAEFGHKCRKQAGGHLEKQKLTSIRQKHYIILGSYAETADVNSTAVPSSSFCQAGSLPGLQRMEKRCKGTHHKTTIIRTKGHISAGFPESEVSIPHRLMLHARVYDVWILTPFVWQTGVAAWYWPLWWFLVSYKSEIVQTVALWALRRA